MTILYPVNLYIRKSDGTDSVKCYVNSYEKYTYISFYISCSFIEFLINLLFNLYFIFIIHYISNGFLVRFYFQFYHDGQVPLIFIFFKKETKSLLKMCKNRKP